MAAQSVGDFRLTVLNPSGRDPEQHFAEGADPAEGEHPPINFHAYAACTRGAFHYDTRRAIAGKRQCFSFCAANSERRSAH